MRIGATNVLIFAATVAAADDLATVVVVVGAVVVAVVEFDEPFDEPPPVVCFHFRVFPAPTHTNTTDLTLRMTPAFEHRVPAMFGVAACVAGPTATRASNVAAARQPIRRLVVVRMLLLTVGRHRSDKGSAVI
ncbi:MAG: hypothetical protein ACKOAI_02530 [Acidimicrobiia bacterium]